MDILSLFDGMGCGRLAIEKAGIKIDNYYVSEISKAKIKASKNYFPDNIYLGDIVDIKSSDLPKIDMIIGGSPCVGFSIAGKRLNFDDPRSALIEYYFRLVDNLKPKYFLLENVPMAKECEIEISRRLGVLPIKINSALLSAQNRKRNYWTNIPGLGADLFGLEIEQPSDKGIMLRDILQPENEVDEKYYLKKNVLEYVKKRILDKKGFCKLNGDKSKTLLEGYNSKWNGTYISRELFNIYKSGHQSGRVRGIDGKAQTLMSQGDGGGAKTELYLLSDMFINKNQNGVGYKKDPEKSYTLNTVDRQVLVYNSPHGYNKGVIKLTNKSGTMTSSSFENNQYVIENIENLRIRKLTPIECCRLQNVPDDFFDGSGLSDNQIYSCLGDGWTVDVIVHILQGVDFPKIDDVFKRR